jgi:Flp pilus assembly protein TadG
MMWFAEKLKARQRGAVLAEMALVTPILLVLLLVTADLTRAFIEHNTVTKAVRNGARYVAANAFEGTTGVVNIDATLRIETQNLVVFGSTTPPGGASPVVPGLTLANITVVQIAGTDDIAVSATYALGGLFGPVLPINLYSGNTISTARTLRATVTMRAL